MAFSSLTVLDSLSLNELWNKFEFVEEVYDHVYEEDRNASE
jgi:hypothetical protein